MLTVIKAFLTAAFAVVLYFCWKKKKLNLERIIMPALACLCILSTFVAFFISGLIPDTVEEVRITAVDDKNEAALNTEIYLVGTYRKGKKLELQVSDSGRWFWTGNWYTWRAENDSRRPTDITNSFIMLMPSGTGRELRFLTNKYKGIVTVEYQTNVYMLDCYSEEGGVLRAEIPDTPAVQRIFSAFLRLAAFTGGYCLCILIAIVLIRLHTRRVRSKQKHIRAMKRKNDATLEEPMPIGHSVLPVVCLVVVSLSIGWFVDLKLPAPREPISVTPLESHNSKSVGNTVCVRLSTANTGTVEVQDIGYGGWRLKNDCCVWRDEYRRSGYSASQKMILALRIGKDRSIIFQTAPDFGYVQFEFLNQVWLVDCYSAEAGEKTIVLPDSAIGTRCLWRFLGLVCVFVPVFVILTLLAGLAKRHQSELKAFADQAPDRLVRFMKQDDIVWARRICTLVFLLTLIIASITMIHML